LFAIRRASYVWYRDLATSRAMRKTLRGPQFVPLTPIRLGEEPDELETLKRHGRYLVARSIKIVLARPCAAHANEHESAHYL
jgi:hypothetical protein